MLAALYPPLLLLVQAALFIAPGLVGALWLRKARGLPTPYVVLTGLLTSCLIGYAAFWVYFASPLAGKWLSTLLLVASWLAVFYLLTSRPARTILRQTDVLVPIVLMISVAFFYNAIFIGCETHPGAPSCYTTGLPADNQLPQFFADNTAAGHANTPFGNWLSSDRPPLQAGIVLAQAPFTTINFTGYNGYQLLASLLQCAWVPAMWLLGRKLKPTNKQLALGMALCVVTGFFFFNSVYVWPKLIAAALGMLAFCLLLFEKPKLLTWAIAGVAVGAAYLAHSGVAFAFVPMVGATLLIRSLRPTWKIASLAAALTLVLVAPWLLYQKFYDPPGDRLAKWHIAGVIDVDSRSFPQALYDSYRQAGISGVAHNKLDNVRELIGRYPPEGMLYGGGFLAKLRGADFRYLLVGLAVFNAGWLLLLFPAMRRHMLKGNVDITRLKLVFAVALSSLVLWVLAMFGPGTTVIHQGSYLIMLLLFGGLGALIAQLPARIACSLLAAQATYFMTVWVGSVVITHSPGPSALFVVLLGLGAVISSLLLAAKIAWRQVYQTIKMLVRWVIKQLRRIEPIINAHPALTIVVVVVIAALAIISRRPETIINAQFWAEDGSLWYASAYNHGLGDLLAPYAGYFIFVNRIVGLLSLMLPFHVVPIFFNLVALCIQVLPVFLLCSRRLRYIIPNRSTGILLSLLYVAVPNGAEVFTNLTNIQWHLGVAAFLVLLAHKDTRWRWRTFDLIVLLLTGLSGPFVIFLLPFALFIWWRNKTPYHIQRMYVLATLAALQCLYLFVIDHTSRVGATVVGNPFDIARMLVGQVFTGGILGQQYVNLTYGNNSVVVGLLLAGLGLIVYAFIKGPVWLRMLHIYGAVLIVSMLASLRPVKGFDTWQGLTNPGGGQRYWYIPIIIWLATLVWLAVRATMPLVRGIAITLLLILVLVGIPNSWRITPFPYLNFQDYAAKFEHAPSGTVMTIPINPGWEMQLRKK